MNNVVFVSGQITGDDSYKEKFGKACGYLRSQGYIPLTTADLPAGLSDEDYMRISLAELEAADSIYMLSDWHDSLGAAIEYALAVKAGKKIMEEEVSETTRNNPPD